MPQNKADRNLNDVEQAIDTTFIYTGHNQSLNRNFNTQSSSLSMHINGTDNLVNTIEKRTKKS